jgi:hypothetical protein
VAAADVLDAGNESGGHGAEADDEDAEAAPGGLDGVGLSRYEVTWFQDDTSFACKGHEDLVPLGGDAPGVRPVFDCALAAAEKGSEGRLAAEAGDDASSGRAMRV